MPFDGSGYQRPTPTPDPPRPRPHSRQENVLTGLMIWLVLILFLLPVSAGTLVDLAQYLRP